MEKEQIIKRMLPAAEELGCFLVDVTVSKDNDIVLTIEKETGEVGLQECEKLNDVFLAAFDKDVEDYSLTVSSAGLDQPFKVLKQYVKAVGSPVEVRLKGGKKFTGVLTGADSEGIVARYSEKKQVEGKKRKMNVESEEKFPFEEINSVVPHIKFEQ